MQRTIGIKLEMAEEEEESLFSLQQAYSTAAQATVPYVVQHRCWNRVALHNLTYSKIRATSPLGSQMVCNVIFSVCKAYKNRQINKEEEIPVIQFRKTGSIHFDKRTYTLKGNILSLKTLTGRIQVKMKMGPFQQHYFSQGIPKEAELIYRKGRWYFNLVLDMPEIPQTQSQKVLGVDLGENVIAAISSGEVIDGGKVRHERDKFLAKRRALQSNGSQSAKQLLKKISGKEARRMKQINHEVSKKIVREAVKENVGVIVLEDLKNIRKRIKGGKRMRTRLHRWAFGELQTQIKYKAETQGLRVVFINPAYTSQTCSHCGQLGVRFKNTFIRFPKNKVVFGRVKASGFVDRKLACIDLILANLRSTNREAFTQPKCDFIFWKAYYLFLWKPAAQRLECKSKSLPSLPCL